MHVNILRKSFALYESWQLNCKIHKLALLCLPSLLTLYARTKAKCNILCNYWVSITCNCCSNTERTPASKMRVKVTELKVNHMAS